MANIETPHQYRRPTSFDPWNLYWILLVLAVAYFVYQMFIRPG